MDEPGARVVCLEADGDIVCSVVADRNNIAHDGVIEVVCRISGTTNNPEVVAMEMHGVLHKIASGSHTEVRGRRTYRTAARATGHDDVNDCVRVEVVNAALRQELLCACVSAQDLQQNRNRWGRVRNVVDSETSGLVLDGLISDVRDIKPGEWPYKLNV